MLGGEGVSVAHWGEGGRGAGLRFGFLAVPADCPRTLSRIAPYRQQCPCGRGVRQDRWHAIFECTACTKVEVLRDDLLEATRDTGLVFLHPQVTTMERALMFPTSGFDAAQRSDALGAALGKFSVVMEAYPDLKASANVQQLNEELASTENRVAFARQGFNDAVMSYNTYRQSFPNLLIANRFGHTEDAQLLEFDDSEQIQEAPKISFT